MFIFGAQFVKPFAFHWLVLGPVCRKRGNVCYFSRCSAGKYDKYDTRGKWSWIIIEDGICLAFLILDKQLTSVGAIFLTV